MLLRGVPEPPPGRLVRAKRVVGAPGGTRFWGAHRSLGFAGESCAALSLGAAPRRVRPWAEGCCQVCSVPPYRGAPRLRPSYGAMRGSASQRRRDVTRCGFQPIHS